MSRARNSLHHLSSLPARLIAACIGLYQATLSPDHGPLKPLYPYGFCPHEPSCSEYCRRLMLERGVARGALPCLRRLLSCHPWKRPSDERMRKMAAQLTSQ